MSALTPVAVLLTACSLVALSASGCGTLRRGTASPVGMSSEFYALIDVRSNIVSGGGIKVNGMMASFLPGTLMIEVDSQGYLEKPHVISLSTNILAGDLGQVVLQPGSPPPAKINFTAQGPLVTGEAFINKRP